MGVYDRHILPHVINLAMRNRHLLPYRRRTIAAAEGRVLEIGSGSGLNLPFYSAHAADDLHVRGTGSPVRLQRERELAAGERDCMESLPARVRLAGTLVNPLSRRRRKC